MFPTFPLLVGALILNTLWQLAIGLLAFWFEHVQPFRWIFQKLVFIAGGLFFPIDLFPDGLRRVVANLPFAYQAYWPARLLVAYEPEAFLRATVGMAIYLAALSGVVAVLFALGRRQVHANGG